MRGLRDPDATVRATCADAASREGRVHPDPATLRRLRELARDRDRSVRARAVAALAALDPAHAVRAADDPAPEVRAAFAAAATEAELVALLADPAPEVRAAALIALGDHAGDAALRAAGDPSAVVRRAAIDTLADPDALARLAGDDSPDVATAALIRLTALRGRAAATAPMLGRLADAPPASPERARIALAWLLAS
jgi:HEAT repeat protein